LKKRLLSANPLKIGLKTWVKATWRFFISNCTCVPENGMHEQISHARTGPCASKR
jgi:hypothetical protein